MEFYSSITIKYSSRLVKKGFRLHSRDGGSQCGEIDWLTFFEAINKINNIEAYQTKATLRLKVAFVW